MQYKMLVVPVHLDTLFDEISRQFVQRSPNRLRIAGLVSGQKIIVVVVEPMIFAW